MAIGELQRKRRDFDVIVHGATGFTGQRVASQLVAISTASSSSSAADGHAPSAPSLRLAIAGRSKSKLERLARTLKLPPTSILIADASDHDSLVGAFQRGQVVLACAGPYNHDPTTTKTTSDGTNNNNNDPTKFDGVGLAVATAAVDARTDYLDLCGEPKFFYDVFAKLDDKARVNDVLVASACAFDCVPAELLCTMVVREGEKRRRRRTLGGVVSDANVRNDNDNDVKKDDEEETDEATEEEHETAVTAVEVVHTFSNVQRANATTFRAAADGFYLAHSGSLKRSRNEAMKKLTALEASSNDDVPPTAAAGTNDKPGGSSSSSSSKKRDGGPRPPGTLPVYHPPTDTHVVKFMGADAASVLWSRRYLRYRNGSSSRQQDPTTTSNDEEAAVVSAAVAAPSSSSEQRMTAAASERHSPRISVCLGLPNPTSAYKLLAYGGIFSTLARFDAGRSILKSNPSLFTAGFFTDDGPTEEELASATFSAHGLGYGPNGDVVVRCTCTGSEPGYVATPQMMVALCLTVLHHRDELPFAGGAMTCGALFGDCDAAYGQLRKQGVKFEVVEDSDTNHKKDGEEAGHDGERGMVSDVPISLSSSPVGDEQA